MIQHIYMKELGTGKLIFKDQFRFSENYYLYVHPGDHIELKERMYNVMRRVYLNRGRDMYFYVKPIISTEEEITHDESQQHDQSTNKKDKKDTKKQSRRRSK